MNTLNSMQNIDLREISSQELINIQGGNAVALAGLAVSIFRLALEVSYDIGYAIGYNSASN